MASAIIASIVTALLTLLGTLYIQKIASEKKYRKSALYLYLNLRQLKKEIDSDKKNIDAEKSFYLRAYTIQIDYIGAICDLNEKLSKEDILSINELYDQVALLNNAKMFFASVETNYYNYQTTMPNMVNPYDLQRNNAYRTFVSYINNISNDENYKKNIVEIISKLEKMKDK